MNTEIGTDILKAKNFLDSNELVAIPTETVYGLAANALSEEAVSKIYEAKKRPETKPLSIQIANKAEIHKYVRFIPSKLQVLIDTYMPGPITILLPKSNLISDFVTAGSENVGIRIPDHQLTLALLEELNYPIVVPSANISGEESLVSAKEVYRIFSDKIPYILDGDVSDIGIASTVVGYDETNDEVVIHRIGSIHVEEIQRILREDIQLKS